MCSRNLVCIRTYFGITRRLNRRDCLHIIRCKLYTEEWQVLFHVCFMVRGFTTIPSAIYTPFWLHHSTLCRMLMHQCLPLASDHHWHLRHFILDISTALHSASNSSKNRKCSHKFFETANHDWRAGLVLALMSHDGDDHLCCSSSPAGSQRHWSSYSRTEQCG